MSTYPPVPPVVARNFTSQVHSDTYPAIDSATQSDCTGRAVLITGASKGIGKATAVAFAAAGASHIALTARSDLKPVAAAIEERCKALGKPVPQTLMLKMDVQSRDSVDAAAAEVKRAFGRLDILYNNAGFMSQFKPIADTDPTDWWFHWETNVRGTYHCSRAFLPLLLGTADGLRTIINSSSIGALHTRGGASAYQISKLAVLRLSEFLMAENAPQGLLAYSVHPGAILTELGTNMPAELHSVLTDTPELAADGLVFLTHVRRPWLAGRYVSLSWDLPELLNREREIVDGDKLKMKLVV